MSDIIRKYENYWGDDPTSLRDEYKYQLKLTDRLDEIDGCEIDLQTVYEIVLWKVNRWPNEITEHHIKKLKKLAKLKPKQHRDSTVLLKELLQINGIRLPMASTILRFLNPNTFQIIDDRAFRIMQELDPQRCGTKYPNKPGNFDKLTPKRLSNFLTNSCNRYFSYLDALHIISSAKLPFAYTDRILYQLDIKIGNKVGDEGSKESA